MTNNVYKLNQNGGKTIYLLDISPNGQRKFFHVIFCLPLLNNHISNLLIIGIKNIIKRLSEHLKIRLKLN